MSVPAHLGVEHANLLWLVVIGLSAFASGLALALFRTRTRARIDDIGTPNECPDETDG